MSRHTLTRRSFLAGTAGVAGAATLVGTLGYGTWEHAFAEDSGESADRAIPTICDGCSCKCGFTAYVIDGKVGKIIADSHNPASKGKLCARGYALPQIVDSKDRLTDPMKRNDGGGFDPISWDQAFQEIGEKVKQITSGKGGGSLAVIQDDQPSSAWYSKRFMNALGSTNVYTDAAARTLSRDSGIAQVVGEGAWESDIANSKMTLFIGADTAENVSPAQLQALEQAHVENGASVVIVDPRFTGAQRFADEWVPINPGTELAFVLALCNVVVRNGHYDHGFVHKNGHGFDEFAREVQQYSPDWAADICGVSEAKIAAVASQMANAAPACSIAVGSQGSNGSAYKNSGELGRAIAIFNGLMGCYNQKGGVIELPLVEPGKVDTDKVPAVDEPKGTLVASDTYPLALASTGTASGAIEAAGKGAITGLFFVGTDPVAECGNPKSLAQSMGNLTLSVCIDVQMTATAQQCQYVLPEASYLERSEVPYFDAAFTPAVSLRTQVIDRAQANAKSVDEIFQGLAGACGIGDQFKFSLDDAASAQLSAVGEKLSDLRKLGTISFGTSEFQYGTQPTWHTPTGKFQFASDACKSAGYKAVPSWVEPEVAAGNGQLRLISSEQATHGGRLTADNGSLATLASKYELTRAWVNKDDASELGISDGDEIEISNDQSTGQVQCFVTDRIVKGAVYLPSGYGVTIDDQKTANGVGLRPTDFLPEHLEPGYGSPETNEVLVNVKKVSA